MVTSVEGTVLRGPTFEPVEGRVIVDKGRIKAVEEATVSTDDIVLPAFVNAHIHLGDSIAKEAGEGLSLEELVVPPDGLKHRLLRAATADETVKAIRHSLEFMSSMGTVAFLDFREGGLDGVRMLRDAVEGVDIEPVILGRETEEAMHAADGFGASGARDGEFEAIRSATRAADKLFGIHAGEVDAEDIDDAMDLEPDFLVHMVYPRPAHLERLEQEELPVVVCPRSNLACGLEAPPIAELAKRTTVALGTDNVMVNAPSMFREMEFASKLSNLPAREVLGMATQAGADLAGLNCGCIEPGRDAKLLVLDGASDNLVGVRDVVRAVVRRAGVDDVKRVLR